MTEQTLRLWCGDVEVARVRSSNGTTTIEHVDDEFRDDLDQWCAEGLLLLIRGPDGLTSRRVLPSDDDFLFQIGRSLEADYAFGFALTGGPLPLSRQRAANDWGVISLAMAPPSASHGAVTGTLIAIRSWFEQSALPSTVGIVDVNLVPAIAPAPVATEAISILAPNKDSKWLN